MEDAEGKPGEGQSGPQGWEMLGHWPSAACGTLWPQLWRQEHSLAAECRDRRAEAA